MILRAITDGVSTGMDWTGTVSKGEARGLRPVESGINH